MKQWAELDPEFQELILEKIEILALEEDQILISKGLMAAIDELRLWVNSKSDA